MQRKIAVHHIGARDGTQAFPHLPAFDADIINILVDADAASTEAVRGSHAGRTGEIVIVPACIAGTNGPRTFHHSHDPYASSLLQPDPSLGSVYVSAHWLDCDYTVGDALVTTRKEELDGVTLDTLIVDSGGRIPLPDFLSLDTQGSELEILSGSPHATGSALAVVCEVEFLPLYRGQPLFGDVSAFMHAAGFVFCGCSAILSGSYFRAPLGLRGRHIPVTGDALFLRRPETIASYPDASRRLRKLAFLSLIQGHLEHAQWALAALPGTESMDDDPTAWQQFVDEFRIIASSFPALLPETFAQPAVAATGGRDNRQVTAERIRANKTLLDRRIVEMKTLWERYGVSELADLQRDRLDESLRQYGVE